MEYNLKQMQHIQIIKQMNGVKKMEQAFLMSDFVLDLAKINIKKNLGNKASKKQILIELQKRLKY